MRTSATFATLCRTRNRLLRSEDDRVPTIAELAREASMSTGHFIGLFAAMFGETPHQARTRARMNRAKILLARGEHSVTDVCMTLGFSSLGSFSASFTRRVGTSPSAYRRQVRTLVQVPADIGTVVTPGCHSLMALAFSRRAAPI